MRVQKVLLSCLLSFVILFFSLSPAFAVTLPEPTDSVLPPKPNGAVIFPEGASDGIDWQGVTDDMWELLFTGEKRTINIEKYHIPVSDANKNAIFFPCWYNPRFLRTAPVNLSRSGGYYASINNLDTDKTMATDPAENRAKYDACADAVSQLTYGIKGNDSISPADKCLLLHDRLAAWTAYDYDGYYGGTLPDDSPVYNAYGPLVNHLGVCNGYALAYNWLLEDVGIRAWYENSDALDHGWSKVELDGELYYVDVTWDDVPSANEPETIPWDIPGFVSHSNFLQSFQTFSSGHEDATDFDDAPSSTLYETYFSQNASTEIVRIDDSDYFIEGTLLCKRNVDGTMIELENLNGMKRVGKTTYLMTPKLTAIGSTLLYLTANGVYAYDTKTGESQAVFPTESTILPEEPYIFNGLQQIDGVVKVTASKRQDGLFDETTVADNTMSFVFCEHPTWEPLQNATGKIRSICPACRALCTEHTFTLAKADDAALCSPATCIAPARYYYSCAVCGASENNADRTFTIGDLGDHDWQWVTDTYATCVHPGGKHEECTVCHLKRNENTAIDPTGEHDYSAQTVSADTLQSSATCTAPASYYYSCAVCGAVEKNDSRTFTNGEPIAHSWTWVTDEAPTCAKPGIKHEECTVCHLKRNENTAIDPTGEHSYTAKTVSADTLQSAATCTAPASYYYSCAVCGAIEKDNGHTFQSGDPIAHSWTWMTDEAPTCAKPGSKHEECTVCHLKRSENTAIDPTGEHDYSAQTVSADTLQSAATCTAPASYYYSCAVCGAIEKDNSHTFPNGSPIAHSWTWVTDKAPTCAKPGIKHEECTVCHLKRSENTAIDPTGEHSYTAKTVSADTLQSAATCTAPASYYYSCAVCGAIEKNNSHTFQSGDPIAHSWTWLTDDYPTCAKPGLKHEECAVCHLMRNENTAIDPTGEHDYSAQTVSADALQSAATCTAPASYYYSCTVCGAVENNDEHIFASGSPIAHSWTWMTDEDPTCAKPGGTHEECMVCHLKRSENTVIDPTGAHSYTAKTVSADTLQSAATCTAPASYYYSCAVCGAVEKNDSRTFPHGDPIAHSWTWMTDEAPTCAKPGSKHEECAVCHLKRNENTTIDPTGEHSYTAQTVSADTLQSAATCTAPASYYYSCTVCGAVEKNDSRTFTNGKALDHADQNGNGYCDGCNKDLWSNRCPYCHQVHTGFFGAIVGFFHRILALFQ